MHTLPTEGLEFPMKVKGTPNFEKINTRNTEGALFINVF